MVYRCIALTLMEKVYKLITKFENNCMKIGQVTQITVADETMICTVFQNLTNQSTQRIMLDLKHINLIFSMFYRQISCF